jgi:uncharacterized protein (DUF1697 family)
MGSGFAQRARRAKVLRAFRVERAPIPMPVLICFLRGINVGGHAIIKMDALRALFASLKFEQPHTYVQSGNVIFKTTERDVELVATRIKQAIEKKFACSPALVLRSVADLRAVVSSNPFAKRTNIEPAKLHVFFLAARPGRDAAEKLRQLAIRPEELHLMGRELFIYFPDGVGKSKLPWARVDKALETQGTGRNWNSVTKILELAEGLES